MSSVAFYRLVFLIALFLTAVAGCGGSDSGSSAQNVTVTGSVFAAPVAGAAVTVMDSAGNPLAGSVQTASDGTYSVSIPASALSGTVRVESTGGTFSDEATGATTTAGTLSAYVSAGSLTAGGSIHLDPSSTVIHDLVARHGKSCAEARALFNTAFGFTPDTAVAPKNAPASGADTPQCLAGLRAAAFSQMTKGMSLAPEKQFELIAALADDLSDDGTLNGSAGQVNGTGLPEDVQNRFECSLVSMMTNTTANLTGLTADKIGSLPFAKVALTDAYRTEYVPGMMSAAEGKTAFTLKITRRSDGSAATGLALSLMPVMNMSSHKHATPVDHVTDNGDGTYSCAVYYLMPSAMNGMSMGYWELKVMIGSGMTGEAAAFYPAVGMAMGQGTARATLKGQSDTISSMTGTEKRAYYLFKDSLVSNGTATFKLFIAAKESMMSYPAASVGTVLSGPTGTVTAMTVQASTDGSTWVPAADAAGGHWTMPGLTGLVSGQTNTIYVRVNVNGEDKTTDGNAASGANAYAAFAVMP